MVKDLASIISLINNATDLDKKMVTSAQQLSQAAAMLESFPMTRAHLETTRLGKLLNEVRRFTDSTDLQRRLRRLLKGWQPLASTNDPNYCVVVNGNGSTPALTGVTQSQSVTVKNAVEDPCVAPAAATAPSVDGESGSVGSVGSSASATAAAAAAAPPPSASSSVRIRKRAAVNAAAGAVDAASTAAPAKLTKVRSTAELLTGREGVCPETLARILNNEVPKESDEGGPQFESARHQHHQQQQHHLLANSGSSNRKRRRLESPASASSAAAAAAGSSAPAASLPPCGQSALLHKFLESAVSHPVVEEAAEAESSNFNKEEEIDNLAPSKTSVLPNFLHDWPSLPPLVEFSNADDESEATCPAVRSAIAMYSVPLTGSDASVHILPWVDLDGFQRRFFPIDASPDDGTAEAAASSVW